MVLSNGQLYNSCNLNGKNSIPMHQDFDTFWEFNQSEMLRKSDSPTKDYTCEDLFHKDIYIVNVATMVKVATNSWGSIHMVYPIKKVSTMVNPL